VAGRWPFSRPPCALCQERAYDRESRRTRTGRTRSRGCWMRGERHRDDGTRCRARAPGAPGDIRAARGYRAQPVRALGARGAAFPPAGERPYVSVRQRVRRQQGKGLVVGPLQSGTGTLLDPDNLHSTPSGTPWPRAFSLGDETSPGAAVARPPLRLVHARHLRPPPRGRPRATAGPPAGQQRLNTTSEARAQSSKHSLAGKRRAARRQPKARSRLPEPKVAGSRPVVRFVQAASPSHLRFPGRRWEAPATPVR